jgi:hypothetical protein
MRRMDCAQLADAAPELALGILPGDERAAALAHLDECPSCQQQVSSLAGLTDQLLLLTPAAEPPAGFEQRVLASLGSRPTALRPSRARRRATRATVAALALAACIVLAIVVRWSGQSEPPALAAEQMRTSSGAVVGQVFVHRERPAVLFMSLPGWAQQVTPYRQPGDTYSLRIERRDGPARVLPVAITADASWATTLDFDPKTIIGVAMVDSQGRVWCRARFDPPV